VQAAGEKIGDFETIELVDVVGIELEGLVNGLGEQIAARGREMRAGFDRIKARPAAQSPGMAGLDSGRARWQLIPTVPIELGEI